jgi:hypothetical protein
VREREDVNRTRVAGHLDEIQGVVAHTLKLLRKGAVGFIDWLDAAIRTTGAAVASSEDAESGGVSELL